MTRKNQCWLIPKSPPLIVQLGRIGDHLLLFPAYKLIYERTGMEPVVITCQEYATVFDGISYATPHVIPGHWYSDMPKARALAEKLAAGAIPAQWWEGDEPPDMQSGFMVSQCHGLSWGPNPNRYPDFGTGMWARLGFTREEMLSAPLEFDRRNATREAELVKRYTYGDRPLLLYNFDGISSPFGYVPEVMRLFQPFKGHFNMLDLGKIRATRIYDLLALYDRAVGLITIDTATTHLAPASKVPTLWLTVPGWTSSAPRGNVALHIPYDQVPMRLGDIHLLLERWKSKSK